MLESLDSRIQSESFRVTKVSSAKCWYFIYIEGEGTLQIHIENIRESLVDKLEGNQIQILRKRDPMGQRYIAGVVYNKEFVYPRMTQVETQRYHQTGMF